MSELRDLFPPIEPYANGTLKVDDLHEIYWERCGNPQGYPVVFLHGGPGWACSDVHRRFFDPAYYNIHLFDQRGAGRSRPLGEIRQNNTNLLIADIEQLRKKWRVDKWHVFGGSWGSTLALAYAQTHPEAVSALILRGIFLLRRADIVWFLTQVREIWPEHGRMLLDPLSEAERADVIEAYYQRLTNPDPAIHMPAAMAWVKYEIATSSLLQTQERLETVQPGALTLSQALMEAHYFRNNLFEPDDKLLRDVGKIRHIPATIVQGRYDLVCPLRSADDLHNAWPEAEYVVVPDAGHSALEPGIRRALVAATEKLKAIR
jgi:proline iminopeptidase